MKITVVDVQPNEITRLFMDNQLLVSTHYRSFLAHKQQIIDDNRFSEADPGWIFLEILVLKSAYSWVAKIDKSDNLCVLLTKFVRNLS